MELQKITDEIFYLPATNDPLSADVGIVHGDKSDWIFDVGNTYDALETIENIKREKNVVLSHFHVDHSGNLSKITYSSLYCGDFTKIKFSDGIVIDEPKTIIDGVKLTLFPLPPLHSKGSICLVVNDEYAFLGDATFGAPKKDYALFNVNFLKDTIETLENLKAQKFLISHRTHFVKDKEQIIAELKRLYRKRQPGEAYLPLD